MQCKCGAYIPGPKLEEELTEIWVCRECHRVVIRSDGQELQVALGNVETWLKIDTAPASQSERQRIDRSMRADHKDQVQAAEAVVAAAVVDEDLV